MSNPQTLDFLAIGPQRTASTWLDQCLRAHPNLYLPKGTKETFYANSDPSNIKSVDIEFTQISKSSLPAQKTDS